MFALFSLQKNFIGYSDDIPEHINSTILKKEIPEDKRDLTKWRWDGDYDTGNMVSLIEKPYVITEKELQESLFKTIYEKYPIDLQLLNVIKQLYLLSHKSCNLLPEFNEMAKIIIHAVDLYEKQRKFYIDQNES